jgi:hypothetical protein
MLDASDGSDNFQLRFLNVIHAIRRSAGNVDERDIGEPRWACGCRMIWLSHIN